MPSNDITDVFFDLDHTLWDFDRNSSLAFFRIFKKHRIELEVAEFVKEYEPINLIYWKKYRDGIISREELRRGRLLETFLCFKMEIPMETIDFLASSYIEELPVDNHLFPGTLEILQYLSLKYRLHIITNGFGEVQHLKLRNSNIANYFKTVTTSEEVGVRKPHPLIFETAMGNASVLPQHSMMIGDNMEADIEGARKAGMNTLFCNFRQEAIENTGLMINHLLDIKHHL